MIAFQIWDLAVFLALLALLFWILSELGVVPLGHIAYVLIVVAVILFIVWLVMRFVSGRRSGRTVSQV